WEPFAKAGRRTGARNNQRCKWAGLCLTSPAEWRSTWISKRLRRFRTGAPQSCARQIGDAAGAHDITQWAMIFRCMPRGERQLVHLFVQVILQWSSNAQFTKFQKRSIVELPRN